MTDIDHELEPRSTDPDRFARGRLASEDTSRGTGETIGAVIALLGLVLGIPILLLALSGPPPFPGGAPSMKDFVQQLSFEDLISVLVAVVWLAWLYFMVCLVVEVIAARRGRVARSLPLSGPVQRLARVLIGAVLLTGLVAGPAQAAEAASVTQGTSASISATIAAPVQEAVADAAEATAATAADEVRDTIDTPADSLVGKKVYTVKAPQNGYHDNLWDIAERHLGDGRRYTEIYELNKDRIQPDSGRLELAKLIQPGWDFVMPGDATGVQRVADPTPAPAPAPTEGSSLATSSTDAAADQAAVSDAADQNTTWWAGAGLLAAGILGALALQRRRQLGRRPDDDALDVEGDLMIAATVERSTWVDQALRRLARQCREAATVPPSVYAAIVGDDSIDLLIAPAAPIAVEGWEVLEDGARWRHERTETDLAPEIGAVPYPALVSLGLDDDGLDVMLDLEAAGGIVSIGGDSTAAGEVAAALAIQCATSPWSADVQVTAADLPEGLDEVGDDRIRVVTGLGGELDRFEQEIGALRSDVLTGRMSRRGRVTSHVLVAGSEPEDAVAQRLASLVGAGRQALAVVIAGDHPAARWRLTVDEFGALSAPQLGLTVSAYRMAGPQIEAIAELFSAARDEDAPDHSERVSVPVPAHEHDDVEWSTAVRRIGVLGDVSVHGGGSDELTIERSAQVTELVVYLALQAEAVHPNVLAGVVWPRGVTPDVRDAAIDRARSWLGTSVEGSHFLRADAEGRLSLADEVVCDWDVVLTLLQRSRRATTTRDEADALSRALGLVRGEAFSAVPEGRYGWVAREDMPRTMTRVLVDAAKRLCDLNGDDPGRAASAAQAGLLICPGSQPLWRELIRASYDENGPAGIHRTLDQMSTALQGIALEAETEALVEELLPDTGSMRSSG